MTRAESELEKGHVDKAFRDYHVKQLDIDFKEQNSNTNVQQCSSDRGWRFWTIFSALCLASLLTALDATIISTTLPTISADLDSFGSYVWVINAYTLSITAVQPCYGQLANVFGRRLTLVGSWVLFMLGSGLCGGARTMDMLIAGRAVQGMGGAGLNILPAMIVCDLIPLKERQLYQSLVYAAFAVGTFIGPVVGGALAPNWRWIFFMNLPICALGLLFTLSFLRLNAGKDGGILDRLRRIDYFGNSIFIAAMIAVLIALSDARSSAQWRSWRTLGPLFLGILGLGVFVVWNNSRWCPHPTIPSRLFGNRTTAAAFAVTFLHGVVLYWTSYFLPIYFQSVRLASPLRSGICTLPSVIPLVPFGIIGAISVSKTNRFRENQTLGFAEIIIAAGCFSTMNEHTPTAVWVVLQVLFAAGAGIILTAVLPAIQAPLPESDVAAATATWGFIQSLGFVCGAAIPSNIFNTSFQRHLSEIQDAKARATLSDGAAYERATKAFLLTLDANTRQSAISIFAKTLSLVWQVEVAFAGLGFMLSFLLKNVKLRDSLDTEYGYKERDRQASGGGVET